MDAGEQSLSRKLLVALLTPLVLLVAVGAVLAHQVQRMRTDSEWVDHTDEVISKSYDVLTQVLAQEASVRGYLLTGREDFLDPYRRVNPGTALTELQGMVLDNPAQVQRVIDAKRRYENWRDASARALGGDLAVARSIDSMKERRDRMDEFRSGMDAVRRIELDLRSARALRAAESRQSTNYAFFGLTILLAAVLGFTSRRQLSEIARTFNTALDRERKSRIAAEREDWIRNGQVRVAETLQGDLTIAELARRTLHELAPYMQAEVGAFYAAEGTRLARVAGYSMERETASPAAFAMGEGLIGEVAASKKLRRLTTLPEGYLRVRSGMGESSPKELLLLPAHTDGAVHAVLEFGFFKSPDDETLRLLERVAETIGMAVRSAAYKARLQELLEESQRQAEELQTQQEELRVANEELQSQSDALRQAHAQLEERKEELETSNTSLAAQRDQLTRVQQAVEEKATELERASRYKSEFLANMSHELRTPLNSSLILAKLLADNRDGNLTAEQIKFANTIYSAGNDLLVLINDVLDLSKIEAGKIEVRHEPVGIQRAVDWVMRTLEPAARDKKLSFVVEVASDAPPEIDTDLQKLQQILKNLLANAIKFTERGEVSLRVRSGGGDTLMFSVTDSGIGIPRDQQEIIFEAFRQADGTTNRRFGGTGLGLSISRDLARLLGGDIRVESTVGQGSTFTLTLPRVYAGPPVASLPSHAPAPSAPRAPRSPRTVPPPAGRDVRLPNPLPSRTPPPGIVAKVANGAAVDSDKEKEGRAILVIEDDVRFSDILVDLAHELDFRCLVAQTADEGMKLALDHLPSAVLLDMNLPDHSGLSVLDRLKRNPKTRHIPVHVISVADYTQQALSMGAAGYLQKPTKREDLVTAFHKLEERFSRRVRRLLVVDDDETLRESISKLLGSIEAETVGVGTVREALERLRETTFDCIVTDLTLPDASGFDLLETMANDESFAFPPVIVYTGRNLSEDEEQRLRRYSNSIIVKGARSPERLLDEVTLFLHQVESDLPADQQRMLRRARDREAVFEGRRILVAEDDVRNIFALSSVLEPKGVELVIARNGREALQVLEGGTKIDLVLMDLMMPEMDGLEATRAIRKRGEWAKLPIIALTAKAMRDDQERCLQAGANDYIAKPLDVEMLLSLLRVWMPK